MLLISFSFLAYTEKSQRNIENSWFLYFENPQDDSLSFIIENFSDKQNFSWSLFVDGEAARNEDIVVLKNNKINVKIEKLSSGKNFLIKVNNNKETRDIYKTF